MVVFPRNGFISWGFQIGPDAIVTSFWKQVTMLCDIRQIQTCALSGNRTWQWNIFHLFWFNDIIYLTFPRIKPFFTVDLPISEIAFLDVFEGRKRMQRFSSWVHPKSSSTDYNALINHWFNSSCTCWDWTFQPQQTRLFDLFDTHPVLGGAFGAINVYN